MTLPRSPDPQLAREAAMNLRSSDTSTPTGDGKDDGGMSGGTARRAAMPAVAFEVLLGSGVLAAWIVAIYVGLAFFKHLAGPRHNRTADGPQEATMRGEGEREWDRSRTPLPFGRHARPGTS